MRRVRFRILVCVVVTLTALLAIVASQNVSTGQFQRIEPADDQGALADGEGFSQLARGTGRSVALLGREMLTERPDSAESTILGATEEEEVATLVVSLVNAMGDACSKGQVVVQSASSSALVDKPVDLGGRVTFAGIPIGPCMVTSSRGGLARFEARAGECHHLVIQEPSGVRCTIAVHSSVDSEPLAGAGIFISHARSSGRTELLGHTDAKGWFAIESIANDVYISVEKDGYILSPLIGKSTFSHSPARHCRIDLHPQTGSSTLQIIDHGTSAPVPSATAMVSFPRRYGVAMPSESATILLPPPADVRLAVSPLGEVVIPDGNLHGWSMSVSAEGYADWAGTDDDTIDGEVRLRASSTFTVEVVGPDWCLGEYVLLSAEATDGSSLSKVYTKVGESARMEVVGSDVVRVVATGDKGVFGTSSSFEGSDLPRTVTVVLPSETVPPDFQVLLSGACNGVKLRVLSASPADQEIVSYSSTPIAVANSDGRIWLPRHAPKDAQYILWSIRGAYAIPLTKFSGTDSHSAQFTAHFTPLEAQAPIPSMPDGAKLIRLKNYASGLAVDLAQFEGNLSLGSFLPSGSYLATFWNETGSDLGSIEFTL